MEIYSESETIEKVSPFCGGSDISSHFRGILRHSIPTCQNRIGRGTLSPGVWRPLYPTRLFDRTVPVLLLNTSHLRHTLILLPQLV